MKKYFNVIFLILVYLACILSSKQSVRAMKNFFNVMSGEAYQEKLLIVVDPGHGGRDPGKVGVNGALEKDINLSISMKLRTLLEDNRFEVIMTREEDIGLYEETDSNKKRTDLNNRIHIINEANPLVAISVHQNSFTQENIKGAQVFYHQESPDGRRLAEILQAQIKGSLGDDNHRKAKSNTSYYMLKKTECPLVIVECGYLSNNNEASLLVNEEYQEKLALGIYLGIIEFLDK
ncbi:MAG TPA: N-acetylmuramoyl-L-alanine amidase [Clostridiales bacterium]|nr:N-acetylmuramoyl-L-alanine amidase [Clostridiales bacterium]